MDRLPDVVSTVLFDVGNTLNHLDYGLIAHTLTRHGHAVTAQQVAVAECAGKAAVDAAFRERHAGGDANRRVAYFETIIDALRVPGATADTVVAELKAEDRRASLWRVMHADTPDVLVELRRRGITLAVVSNADGRVSATLQTQGVAEHFVAIIDSHNVGVEKPDARIFGFALDACPAPASQAIYVGDIYEIDVCGARNAGITPVLLDPLGHYSTADCRRINALTDLLDLLPPASQG